MPLSFTKRLIYGLAYLCLAALIYGVIFKYSELESAQRKQVVSDIKQTTKNRQLDTNQFSLIKSILQDQKDMVYFTLQDPTEKTGLGLVNAESFSHGASFIQSMLQEKGMLATFESLKNSDQVSSPYIKLMQDYWIEHSVQVRYAYLNPTNFLQWGHLGKVIKYGLYGWYLLGLLMFLLYVFYKPKALALAVPIAETVEEEKENIKFLQERADQAVEQESEKEVDLTDENMPQDFIIDEEEDDTKIDDIPAQVWIRLLDEPDLKDWENRGQFYVRNDKKGLHAIGFPWGSSIVTRKEVIFPEFIFEAEARILSGNEGFVVLFLVGNFCLSWVIGGWGNSKSVVMGYESTKTSHQVHRKKWYHVRIELEENEVIGYIDGRTAWTLQKSDVTKDSPELGFQKGMGVGVWKTTTKFRNIRVLKV